MRIIGFAGLAGSGKDTAASFIPGGWAMGFADPLYEMVAVLTRLTPEQLRNRDTKEERIDGLGVSPRFLLQTLGTEWGRDTVDPDLWVKITARRLDALASRGIETVVLTDVRFANEATLIRDRGGEVWRIDRPGTARMSGGHRSEDGLPASMVDRVILNDGTRDDLRAAVLAAWRAAPCRV
jgi:hypothetical protein